MKKGTDYKILQIWAISGNAIFSFLVDYIRCFYQLFCDLIKGDDI